LSRNTVDTFLLVNGPRVQVFDGDLEDYQSWLELPLTAPTSTPKPANPRKLDRQRVRGLRAGIAAAEKRLTRLQGKLQDVEEQLADPHLYSKERNGDLQDLLRNRLSLVDEIQQTEDAWLEHSSVLEDLHESDEG